MPTGGDTEGPPQEAAEGTPAEIRDQSNISSDGDSSSLELPSSAVGQPIPSESPDGVLVMFPGHLRAAVVDESGPVGEPVASPLSGATSPTTGSRSAALGTAEPVLIGFGADGSVAAAHPFEPDGSQYFGLAVTEVHDEIWLLYSTVQGVQIRRVLPDGTMTDAVQLADEGTTFGSVCHVGGDAVAVALAQEVQLLDAQDASLVETWQVPEAVGALLCHAGEAWTLGYEDGTVRGNGGREISDSLLESGTVHAVAGDGLLVRLTHDRDLVVCSLEPDSVATADCRVSDAIDFSPRWIRIYDGLIFVGGDEGGRVAILRDHGTGTQIVVDGMQGGPAIL